MQIRILRHGETEYNREWRFLGRKDLPLTEEGRRQLFASKDRPGRVYVSGLKRTLQTAQILYPGAEYIAVPELQEMDFGAFEGRTWMELQEEPAFQKWIESERFEICPGGEGRKEFSDRICNALIALVQKEESEGTQEITIVSHGGTIMAAMERFCTDLSGQYGEWRLGNGEGYLLESTGQGRNLRWHIRKRLSYAKNAGRVHLYYGEGRGKTSIAMGTALRALAQGREVRIVQFCKNEGSGETKQLETLGAIVSYGKDTPGFVSSMTKEEKEKLRERQTKLLERIAEELHKTWSGSGRMLILDEVCTALEQEVLDEKLLWELVLRKPSDLEILMTGRHPKAWMAEAADYVTELKSEKHPFEDGLAARSGIEF
ncbi:MAG: cob(I)yrinic acid a,c-diamide adenosyltransferase [Lachnospiraceae bacterium]|nr:cob(I)yrinic acid a,c-diamide adenosyltransferase [Lachnospiraceae bacterium]